MQTWSDFSERLILLPAEIDLSAVIGKSKNRGGCSPRFRANTVWDSTKKCYGIDTIWVYLKLLVAFFDLSSYFKSYSHLSALIHFWWFWIIFYINMVWWASEELYWRWHVDSMELDHTSKELKSDLDSELSEWRTVSAFIHHQFMSAKNRCLWHKSRNKKNLT